MDAVDSVLANLAEGKPHLLSAGEGGTNGADSTAAPPELEKQYRELFGTLSRGLIGGDSGSHRIHGGGRDHSGAEAPRNVSAVLMGPKGNGKSLVLERALAEIRRIGGGVEGDEGKGGVKTSRGTSLFRIVRLNGLLVRGDDVGGIVREIVRQLSEIAEREHILRRKRLRVQKDLDEDRDDDGTISSKLLRLRHSSFTSNLSLLDETLRIAFIDSIPIVIVLDELDAFLSSGGPPSAVLGDAGIGAGGGPASTLTGPSQSERQLLLYHLLDRVADHGSLLSLVGITSRLSTVGMFEKRVKSRAEGTSKVIYFGHPKTFEGLVKIMASKFDKERAQDCAGGYSQRLRDQLKDILLPSARKASDHNGNCEEESDSERVREMFQRNYNLGRDVRWFCRVLSEALSLLAEDFQSAPYSSDNGGSEGDKIDLTPGYLMEGLVAMGGTFGVSDSDRLGAIVGGGHRAQDAGGQMRVGDDNSAAADPRLRALLDLPPPQLAVLLAARRVLRRDDTRADDDASRRPALTYDRLRAEYHLYRRTAAGGHALGSRAFFKAFVHLVETDLVRPAADHTGGGALQYLYRKGSELTDEMTAKKVPLHILVDVERELERMLKDGRLDCPTLLKEWGMRIG